MSDAWIEPILLFVCIALVAATAYMLGRLTGIRKAMEHQEELKADRH
jgi:hypothetical protein